MRPLHYLFWLHCIFIVLVPWFIIAILNFLLLHTVINKTNSVFNNISNKNKVFRMKKNRQMTITNRVGRTFHNPTTTPSIPLAVLLLRDALQQKIVPG